MDIYITKNDTQLGPFSEDQLMGMLSGSVVSPRDLAWCEGAADWQALYSLLGLPAPPPSKPLKPKGVGGWLLIFCVGLTVLGPLITLGQIGASWHQAEPAFVMFPTIKTVIMWENFGFIVFAISGFVVGCIIWSGHSEGRNLARRFLLIRFIGFVTIEVIALFLMSGLPAAVISQGLSQFIIGIAQHSIIFLIWWFYFKKSKRVRNTYGEE
jgi:hypothetical protein